MAGGMPPVARAGSARRIQLASPLATAAHRRCTEPAVPRCRQSSARLVSHRRGPSQTACRVHAPSREQAALATPHDRLERLRGIKGALIGAEACDQVTSLRDLPAVQAVLDGHREVKEHIDTLTAEQQAALLSVIACGQEHVVTILGGDDWPARMTLLADDLVKVMQFYDSLGGIVGYQIKCLELIRDARAEAAAKSSAESSSGGESDSNGAAPGAARASEVTYLVPEGLMLQGPNGRAAAHRAAGEGLRALKYLAEIYPLGGAGDRLGLQCDKTGEPLPAAMLLYCGRTMIEGLIRDLQAREYLHYQIFGCQHVTPIAIMTSDAKGNHARVSAVLEDHDYFGRPASSIQLFCQPLVPVLEVTEGRWLLPEALRPSFKPGGHGAIWKLMWDKGIFKWLKAQRYRDSRALGFASCDRAVGAAEGMNVLAERRTPGAGPGDPETFQYGITNVEYTEFERLGICDQPVNEHSNQSCFPANTNILYVGLRQAEAAVRAGIESGGGAALPGMIFNLNKTVTYTSAESGAETSVNAGRMECTMQNLADELLQQFPQKLGPGDAGQLDTFVVYNERRCVTSSAKRKHVPGSTKLHQTPDGSFLDLMRNARDVLTMAGVHAPPVGSTEDYLASGPGFIFLFHPALGPMWQVVAQKVRGGSLAPRAEVVLEVAELRWRDVDVSGSLVVRAEEALGHWVCPTAHHAVSRHAHASAPQHCDGAKAAAPAYKYSDQCGRVRLERVRVANAGIDYAAPGNRFWAHRVQRAEACEVVLEGRSEFEARDVLIRGAARFVVPDGFRMRVLADASSAVGYRCEVTPLADTPSWTWEYSLADDGDITLALEESATEGGPPSLVPSSVSRTVRR